MGRVPGPRADVPDSWSLNPGLRKPLGPVNDVPWRAGGTERHRSVSLAGLGPQPTSPG